MFVKLLFYFYFYFFNKTSHHVNGCVYTKFSDEFGLYIWNMASTSCRKTNDLWYEYSKWFFHFSKWSNSNSEANEQRMQSVNFWNLNNKQTNKQTKAISMFHSWHISLSLSHKYERMNSHSFYTSISIQLHYTQIKSSWNDWYWKENCFKKTMQ